MRVKDSIRGGAVLAAGGLLLTLAVPFAASGDTTETFPSAFQAIVELPMMAGVEIELKGGGPTTVARSEILTGPAGPYIDTEIISMTLTGGHPLLGPVTITEAGFAHSTGKIENIQLGPRGEFLSGDSFFDVFFVIESPGLMPWFQNGRVWNPPNMPFRVRNHITALPPHNDDPYYHSGPPVPVGGLPPGMTNPVFLMAAKAGGHQVQDPAPLPGAGSHKIIVTATGRRDPMVTDCLIGPVTLHASDASQPPHTIMSVTTTSITAGGGAQAATGSWSDPEGDGVFATRAVNSGAGCVPVTVTVTATFTDGHTATATITFLQRN